ncbi:MAG: aminopeptidase P family protein [Ruminococcaceae bacterium]|nr:aminopeptidase P family protein [Oscillospiraceae bacterium]
MTHLKALQDNFLTDPASAVLVSSELNQRYLSGFAYSDGYVLVMPSDAYLLADFRYIEAAEKGVKVKGLQVRMPKGSMLDEVASLLRTHGIRTVYVEEKALSYADFCRFETLLSGMTLKAGASAYLSRQRNIKTDEELVLMAKAQSITDKAFTHILSVLSPRMTEIDVALELEYFMRRNGADGLAFDTIAVSGSASALPHGVPRNVPLEKGFLTMDFGATYEGYCSDMTRTVVMGRADDEMKRLYGTVLDAQRAALACIAEGVHCREADAVARNLIHERGYEGCFGHSLGHGVGLYIHEPVRLASSAPAEEVLVRGNVVTVEPGIYRQGQYGCRIEDMVAVCHDGTVRNFTQSPKELIEI